MTQPTVEFDDAWESIPLEYVDDVLAYLDQVLQPTRPLRAFKLFRVVECWRKEKYLVEKEEPSDLPWIMDMEKKKRIRWKTCFCFKRLETQEELDAMLQADRCT